jgi:cell fate regulator YaaT (PSP1 superfamily)
MYRKYVIDLENIVGVRFRKTGKMVYVDPGKYGFRLGDLLLANTDRGQELGRVVKVFDKDSLSKDIEIITIIRPGTKNDLRIFREIEEDANRMLILAKKEVNKLNLKMKLLMAEYTFDKSKLIIYFTAEERIDFRDLVKALASEIRARIELRQIGPRDEIKIYPNLGMCGKEVCCRTYLQDFKSVSIKDAKEQGLQINMSKLSGACGRLMCCLKYEDKLYKENLSKMPKQNEIVTVKSTKEKGKVCGSDILNLRVKVKFGDSKENEKFETYELDEITWNK